MEENRDRSWGMGLLVGLTAALAASVAWLALEHHELKGELREERQLLQRTEADVLRLMQESARWQQEAMEGDRRVAGMQAELMALKEAGRQGSAWGSREAVRVQAYVGRQHVGGGWLVPPNATEMGEPASATAPQVVLDLATFNRADRSSRSEPPTATATVNYIQQTLPASSPYWYSGGWVWCPTNAAGTGTGTGGRFPSPPERTPPDSRTFVNSGLWRPTEPPFLPAPSKDPINTPPASRRIVLPMGGGGIPAPAAGTVQALQSGGISGRIGP